MASFNLPYFSKPVSYDRRHPANTKYNGLLWQKASRKHVACPHPPAMQLQRAPPPIEASVGCARARIWPGSVGSYGFAGMPSAIASPFADPDILPKQHLIKEGIPQTRRLHFIPSVVYYSQSRSSSGKAQEPARHSAHLPRAAHRGRRYTRRVLYRPLWLRQRENPAG